MIYGIGTDLVEIARMEALWQKHGRRFAAKILSAQELPELDAHPQPARLLAKRFAAKEALAKAVGSGLRAPVSLSRISVIHDSLGKPALHFDPTLRLYLAQLGISAHHLSLSDERQIVAAFVVLEMH